MTLDQLSSKDDAANAKQSRQLSMDHDPSRRRFQFLYQRSALLATNPLQVQPFSLLSPLHFISPSRNRPFQPVCCRFYTLRPFLAAPHSMTMAVRRENVGMEREIVKISMSHIQYRRGQNPKKKKRWDVHTGGKALVGV